MTKSPIFSFKASLKVTFISSSLLLGACATTGYERQLNLTPAELASMHVQELEAAYNSGEKSKVPIKVSLLLGDGISGIEKAKLTFKKHPEISDIFVKSEIDRIQALERSESCKRFYKDITKYRKYRILSDVQINTIEEQFNAHLAESNQTGRIEFLANSNVEYSPILQSKEHQSIIFKRSIDKLKIRGFVPRTLKQVVSFAKSSGLESEAAKLLKDSLPFIHITSNELKIIETIFPEYAKKRAEEVSLNVYFDVINADRIERDEIKTEIERNIRGIQWAASPSESTLNLTIEKIRYREEPISRRSQTVSYPQYQVDLVGAMLMPQNASYIYEVQSERAAIEFGYAVTAVKNEKIIFDKVTKGEISDTGTRCINMRIRNVFGGETAANFMANDDMKSRCSNSGSASMDSLRNQVINNILVEIKSIPVVARVHDQN